MIRAWAPAVVLVLLSGLGTAVVVTSPPALACAEAPCPPGTTTDDTNTGFEAGSEEAGEPGSTTAVSQPPPAAPPSAGTWAYDGPACDWGGLATCTEVERCADGSVPERWVKYHQGQFVASADVCPGDPLPGDDTTTTTPAIDPREELKRVALPEAVINVQPPDGETLVNLPTIFSTDARSYTAPALRVLDHTVVFTLTPESYTWHHGDGTTQTTTTPGRKFADGDEPTNLIHHAYDRTADDIPVSVDITWFATWTLDGKDRGAVDGTVTKTGAAQQLDVLEATPTLVN